MRLCGVEETVVARIRDVFWHIQQRLRRIVKERGNNDLFSIDDSERLPDVREAFLNGEGSRSKDCRIVRFEHAGRQNFRDVYRRCLNERVQRCSMGSQSPLNPEDGRVGC